MDAVRLALVETALERAGEQLGDITPLVMARFSARCPEALASFVHHWPHDPERLAAEMVDNALYCVMTWFERRSEIEILIQSSVPHHTDSLGIPAHWYAELLGTTVDVLAETCPAEVQDEAAMWAQLRAALTGLAAAG